MKIVLVGMFLAGCRGCEPTAASGSSGAGQGAAPSTPPAKKPGVLLGSVRLAPGHQLPAYSSALMERKVLAHIDHGTFPTTCTPPKVADRQPVRATADGKLIGVLVTASDFSHNPERAPRTYDVAIEDCRLTPSFIAAQKGDSLRITNRVNFPFMPTFGPTALVETLVPGQKLDVPLNTPGVNDVLCGFTAPCGRTDVVVLQHPLYAVTDEHGDFRIDDFPVGETVHVNAWHPLFDAQELSVRVESGSAQKLDFVITPVAGSELAASPTQATQAPASSKP